ncbi:beta-lactamase-like protein [Aspergillus nidulans var. acristatus]
MPSILQADVYVSSHLPLAIKRLREPSSFSPISCTLIHAEAILVDTPLSISQTEDLAGWIKATAPGKDVRYVYITRGHGVQWFGLTVLRKHWPSLRALATPGTIAHMHEQLKPETLEGIWLTLFPGGQIPPRQRWSCPRQWTLAPWSSTSKAMSSAPSNIRFVVAGDAVYGDVHQYFGEATTVEKRKEWLRALDTIEALDPHTVIAGHKRAGTADGLLNVCKTRQYILDFEDAVDKASNWEEQEIKLGARAITTYVTLSQTRDEGGAAGSEDRTKLEVKVLAYITLAPPDMKEGPRGRGTGPWTDLLPGSAPGSLRGGAIAFKELAEDERDEEWSAGCPAPSSLHAATPQGQVVDQWAHFAPGGTSARWPNEAVVYLADIFPAALDRMGAMEIMRLLATGAGGRTSAGPAEESGGAALNCRAATDQGLAQFWYPTVTMNVEDAASPERGRVAAFAGGDEDGP